MVSKRNLVGNVDNIAPYTMLYNSTNILCKRLLGLKVVKKIGLIGEKAKNHACKHFKIMRESINPAFYTWIVIKRIAVKVAEFRGELL